MFWDCLIARFLQTLSSTFCTAGSVTDLRGILRMASQIHSRGSR